MAAVVVVLVVAADDDIIRLLLELFSDEFVFGVFKSYVVVLSLLHFVQPVVSQQRLVVVSFRLKPFTRLDIVSFVFFFLL